MNIFDIVIYFLGSAVISLLGSLIVVVVLRILLSFLSWRIFQRYQQFNNGTNKTRDTNNNTNYKKHCIYGIQYLDKPFHVIGRFFRNNAIIYNKRNADNSKRTNKDSHYVVNSPSSEFVLPVSHAPQSSTGDKGNQPKQNLTQ
jgi:hypothetical protein